MGSWLTDLRHAARGLFKNPGYTAVAVLTLALGIGANSAIFSVVNAVVLKPLEYRAPSRLVMVHTQFVNQGFDKFWVSVPEFFELKERSRSFESLALYNTGQSSLEGASEPMRVASASASASLFRVLGVEALNGRVYTEDEDRPGAEAVAVLSYELWQRAFGSDPSWIGRRIEVDGVPRTVVGVMPPRFDIDAQGVEIWLPLALDLGNLPGRASHFCYVVGRLAPGVTLDSARAELKSLLVTWPEAAGGAHTPNLENHPMILTSLHDEVTGDTRPALLMLFGVVGLVLVVACVNVANLLLARAESRQREIAMRSALGATKLVLLRQFLVESVLLALLGCGVGLVLAYWSLRLLLASFPASIPRAAEIALDGRVLLFSIAVSIVTGLLFGLAPLLHLTRRNLGRVISEGGRRVASGRHILRQVLVAAEIAVAVMVVIACGLLLRSFWAMSNVDPGFRAAGLLTFETYLPDTTYPDASSQVSFFRDLSEKLSSIPGVESASAMSGLPPRRRLNANDMEFEGLEPTPDGPPLNVDYWQFVTEDYFDTMKIPIISGRAFLPADAGPASPVVIINETMAKRFWPDQNAVGRRIRPQMRDVPWFTIVGIAKDVKQAGLEEETGTESYFFYPQTSAAVGFAPREMNVVLRSSLPPEELAGSVRQAVWARDPGLPLAGLRSMEEVLGDSLSRPRFVTAILVVFAVLALLLATVGTYGVMSYTVAERTNEIGIRMALGAGRSRVLELVLSQAMVLAGIGLLTGLGGALLLSRFLSAFLFGVGATDPLTLLTVPVILGLAALVACLVPAFRAIGVEPVKALKYE
jgi:putative ABC transport system permease protein